RVLFRSAPSRADPRGARGAREACRRSGGGACRHRPQPATGPPRGLCRAPAGARGGPPDQEGTTGDRASARLLTSARHCVRPTTYTASPERHRVDGGPVLPHLEVHVTPGDGAGGTGVADGLALGDGLPLRDGEAREVVVHRHPGGPVDHAVVDHHLVAVGAVAVGPAY